MNLSNINLYIEKKKNILIYFKNKPNQHPKMVLKFY